MAEETAPVEESKTDVLPRIDGDVPMLGDEEEETQELVLLTPGFRTKKGQPICRRRTIEVFRHRRRKAVPYDREEFEAPDADIPHVSDITYMRAPSEEVMFGCPHHVIDEMPLMGRMVVEDPTFVHFSNRLFKMVDAETQARSYIKGSGDCIDGYEFENGAGTDQEEMDDWQHGGKSPATLMLARDLMPEQQCDEVQLIILETAMNKSIVVPSSEDDLLLVLGGQGIVKIIKEDKEREFLLSSDMKLPVGGLSLIELTCQSEEDWVILIGKSMLDAENDDMLDRALSKGYTDIDSMLSQNASDTDVAEDGIDMLSLEQEEAILKESSWHTRVPEGMVPDLSRLGEDIPTGSYQEAVLWRDETCETIPKEEWRIRKKHRKFMDMLSLTFDSPYMGHGYRAAPPRWQRIMQETPSRSTFIAEQRKEYFQALHKCARGISTLKELYGDIIWACRYCGESNKTKGHQCEHCGREFANVSGFYGRIREKNALDRDIAKEWSERPQRVKVTDENGEEKWDTIPSPFHIKRQAYIEKLERKGLSKRAIDAKVWHWFDRTGGRKEAKYIHTLTCECGNSFTVTGTMTAVLTIKCKKCEKQGKFTAQKSRLVRNDKGVRDASKTMEESVWRQRRSEAYQELHCTKAQWNIIYAQLEIQKKRIRMGDSVEKDRVAAYNVMRRLFRDCDSHAELTDFRERVYRQEIDQMGKIETPSLMDRVSFGDEKRILTAWRKRWLEIAQAKRRR